MDFCRLIFFWFRFFKCRAFQSTFKFFSSVLIDKKKWISALPIKNISNNFNSRSGQASINLSFNCFDEKKSMKTQLKGSIPQSFPSFFGKRIFDLLFHWCSFLHIGQRPIRKLWMSFFDFLSNFPSPQFVKLEIKHPQKAIYWIAPRTNNLSFILTFPKFYSCHVPWWLPGHFICRLPFEFHAGEILIGFHELTSTRQIRFFSRKIESRGNGFLNATPLDFIIIRTNDDPVFGKARNTKSCVKAWRAEYIA